MPRKLPAVSKNARHGDVMLKKQRVPRCRRFMKAVHAVCSKTLVQKAFEATGVWPVDESKVIASEGPVEDDRDDSVMLDDSLDQILNNSQESLREFTKVLVEKREEALTAEIDRLRAEKELVSAEFAEKEANFIEAMNIHARKREKKESELFLARDKRAHAELAEKQQQEAEKVAKKAARMPLTSLQKNDGVTATQSQDVKAETSSISVASGSNDKRTTPLASGQFSQEDMLRARRFIISTLTSQTDSQDTRSDPTSP